MMVQDFRKKTFRGAKIEDLVLELEKLSDLCERNVQKSETSERQRFYEGMAVAYSTIALKLREGFDYIDPAVIDNLYSTTESVKPLHRKYIDECSFCGRNKGEVGDLAVGPGVSICKSCLKFSEEVIKGRPL